MSLTATITQFADGQSFESVLEGVSEETLLATKFYAGDLNLEKKKSFDVVQKASADKKAAFLNYVTARAITMLNEIEVDRYSPENAKRRPLSAIYQGIAKHLLSEKQPLPKDALMALVGQYLQARQGTAIVPLKSWPLTFVLKHVDIQASKNGIDDEEMQFWLSFLAEPEFSQNDKEYQKAKAKLQNILGIHPVGELPQLSISLDPNDTFGKIVNDFLLAAKGDEQKFWVSFIRLALEASGSKPKKSFIKKTQLLFEKAPENAIAKIKEWLHFAAGLPDLPQYRDFEFKGEKKVQTYYIYLQKVNTEALKGMVWICSALLDAGFIKPLKKLCTRCFKPIPNTGTSAESTGNACLYALSEYASAEAQNALSGLQNDLEHKGALKKIDAYLNR